MLTPPPQPPDDRGTRWLQTKLEEILANNAIALAPPRFEGDAACYWGTEQDTHTILYVRLAGDPDLKALQFTSTMIAGCGSGLYLMQSQALFLMRRTLRKMGVLHT